MYYTIEHDTGFYYSAPISENLMELRMQPRSEGAQRCLNFDLMLRPRAKVASYRDSAGNTVHNFDIPGQHKQLVIQAKAVVEIRPLPELPERLEDSTWDALESLTSNGDHWDMLMPSQFAQSTELLAALKAELELARRDDPLTFLRQLNTAIYETFDYVPQSTRVDSPIDHALTLRKGVCQDFAHVMIALARDFGIPCRYVSGYLYHRNNDDRSAEDATHAWVETLLPGLGWVGFDPTNNLLAGDRHIRVAVGRDYADVPPTRGVFKGSAESKLEVAVQVTASDDPPENVELAHASPWVIEEQIAQEQLQIQQMQQ
jgi:transglutaminase-like putative cysteine protease